MSRQNTTFLDDVKFNLGQESRGVKLGIYAVATIGLSAAIYRIRPVSKYSRASQIPSHFMQKREPLKGKVVFVEPDPLRLLVSHHAPIYLPFWHSSKPSLPVQIWGIKLADGNAIGWLQCVVVGNNVVMRPVSRNNDTLVSLVEVHLKDAKTKKEEVINLGQRLVELGLARVTVEKPIKIKKDNLESVCGAALVSAESKAKSRRAGAWSKLPPPPLVIVALKVVSIKATELLSLGMKSLLSTAWRLAKRPFKKNIKQNIV